VTFIFISYKVKLILYWKVCIFDKEFLAHTLLRTLRCAQLVAQLVDALLYKLEGCGFDRNGIIDI
jgi:hypothetical protein